ncbi:hypothetical protein, conserved [Babesia bigemina]|uniref:C3H1-type domain-containing protein n=1 Tax=Babesia bigemina TaxID=5866 RepID=A0A061BTL3_BABBI|nr:hypothetical protein, conserved [Babesia bigemina]CDR71834.1 hypothetical protein, conserved [Babesia bigemina]|eukprot:XP_012770777.1 hypothetical protein, conserved [Babesia bigemina]
MSLTRLYDSETFGAELVEKEKLTPYGTKLAKVFMSIFEMMHEDLSYLKNQCISKWHNRRIYSGSSMGTFLSNCGYTVSNHDSHQNGELRNKAECDGKHIYSTLVGGFSHVYNSREDTKNAFQNLYDHIPTYYRVCQLPTFSSTRRPCSIYEMLRWLSGLPYNAVYLDLMSDDFADLFDKPKEAKTESISLDGISLEDQTPNTLNAYPQKIKRSDLHDAITHITSLAPTVLTTVVGYGDAYSMYAVDYYCNAPSFVYPSSAADCLTMLIELLRRLLPVFRFLHNRCRNMASEYGWYQCRYGTTIDSSNWHCSDHSKTKVDCQPTSPLMSYLKDSLPGHLPHHVTNVDCKSSCSTCPKNLPGQPCLTPLGFRGFSGSTKTGKDICNVLTKFFANAHLTTLLCVIPKPPSTLPEHFEFTLSLTKGWHSKIVPLPLTWVKECIKEQSIALYNDTAQLTNALSNAYNSNHGGNGERHPAAERADLSSLSMTKSCLYSNADNIQCSPYLYALCSDTYHLLAKKHCNLYLSWAVYLPWTFYGYLQALCQSFGNISCQDWGCSRCGNGTKCKKGKHGIDNCKCKGILECRGVLSTFYSYGFTYGNPEVLLNKEGKRYCHNFYQQLKNLLNSKCFTDLFRECDKFIFTIRAPFLWMTVALWSLSLFYLICVMVGRLDVLHIRSHLRSPSSHKITAQSLLAAAQVGRLAKISYLQP